MENVLNKCCSEETLFFAPNQRKKTSRVFSQFPPWHFFNLSNLSNFLKWRDLTPFKVFALHTASTSKRDYNTWRLGGCQLASRKASLTLWFKACSLFQQKRINLEQYLERLPHSVCSLPVASINMGGICVRTFLFCWIRGKKHVLMSLVTVSGEV